MLKKDLRLEYSAKRIELDEQEVARLSASIVDNFASLDLQGIRYLLSYHPLVEKNEFNVSDCEDLLSLENNLGLQIAWPKVSDDGVNMEAIVKTNATPLVRNKFGIAEPAEGELIAPQLIDAMFIPLLAFDMQGYRIGYGKGFYDRYLSRCAQDVVKIGFSFFEAVDSITDINEFDVPLNYCITPLRVYEF